MTIFDPTITMVTLPKNSREEIRVSLDHFMGCDLVNLRVWFRADDGTMRPTKKGVALRAECLSEILEALQHLDAVLAARVMA
ncbi:transcriptional coactivator p15/PC4 family protein [Phaeobacter italicus]|uniref:transcriptional coactivator p15/PC4 family protein n=1 Tax=Phaeobacter italicus TaxID=481446 RepID=UPI001CD74C45|nr:transcriptional coactivator p15/PC4 family protein [Phaeobacter italicus]MCA0857279.1 transcriptional coactivator p15/PC4 family protein [Phaeobacter italicus]